MVTNIRSMISIEGTFFLDGSYGASYQGNNGYSGSSGFEQAYVEASVEPSSGVVNRGEKMNFTCIVKGAQQYRVTWTKYAHDPSLPNYARVSSSNTVCSNDP